MSDRELGEIRILLEEANNRLVAIQSGLYGSDNHKGLFERVRVLESFRSSIFWVFGILITGGLLATGNHLAQKHLELPPARAVIEELQDADD